MEYLRCVVERITYQNTDNGYTVLKCTVKNYSDLVTVVGTMPNTHVGSVLSLEGMWKMDAKYGRQFSVEKFEETLPATVYGIEKYHGSGLVKGVGPKFAKRIVEKFGKDTLDVIEDTPEELLKVPGIGKVRADRIKTSWQEQDTVMPHDMLKTWHLSLRKINDPDLRDPCCHMICDLFHSTFPVFIF